jgi:hypothetical protein
MKIFVINPRPAQSYGTYVTVGKVYEVLGAVSGYGNVIFEHEENNCQYEDSVVVIYDAHTLSNRQAWWVKHLISVPCVKVALFGDVSRMREILIETSEAVVVDDSDFMSLTQILEKAGR